MERLRTKKETAIYFSLSEKQIEIYVKAGLPRVPITSRTFRYEFSAVGRWLKNNPPIPSVKKPPETTA